jgi:hypothetical protein
MVIDELVERLNHMADNHHAIKDSAAMSEAASLLLAMKEALVEAGVTLKDVYEAHRKARNLVPDEEEGLAAQVFCRVINHVDAPIIRTLAKIDATLNQGVPGDVNQ